MTREAYVKHKNVMEWFYAEEGRTVSFKGSNGSWVLANAPSWSRDLIYIPNDHYVELRKALAEGKILEVYNDNYYNQLQRREWVNLDTFNIDITIPLYHYRIKPEEPKFKVGDYFVHNGKPHRVHKVFGDSYQAEDGLDYRENIKPWTIEDASHDDWVLAWNDTVEDLMSLRTKTNYLVYVDICGPFDNVVPYIGQAPDELI